MPRRALGILLPALIALAAMSDIGHAQEAQSDAESRYSALWFDCVAAMQTLALRPGFDATAPTERQIAELRAAADRLETAVSGLMRALPPEDSTTVHVQTLPRLLEVVAAARDVIDAAERADPPAEEAALLWLDEALQDANAALINAVRR